VNVIAQILAPILFLLVRRLLFAIAGKARRLLAVRLHNRIATELGKTLFG
jgi:hypothetical protein